MGGRWRSSLGVDAVARVVVGVELAQLSTATHGTDGHTSVSGLDFYEFKRLHGDPTRLPH